MMSELILTYVVNAAWQIPLAAAAAALLTGVGGLGPRGRHLVWVAALALAVILPALPVAGAIAVAIQPTPDLASLAALPPMTAAPPLITVSPDLARGVGLVWAALALFGLARLILAARAAAALARRADDLVLEPEVISVLAAAARARGVAVPPVKISDEVRGPVVAGRVIVTPRGFARLTLDEQRAALLHELAHVTRRDYAVNLACEAAALPVWWHPAIWAIKSGARRSREMACDAAAYAALGSRETYARRLISLAGALRLEEGAETSPALLTLIGRSDLEARLLSIIRGPRAPVAGRIAAGAVLAVAVAAPAVLLHVTPALAETPTVALAQVEADPARPAVPAQSAVPVQPADSAPPAPPAAYDHPAHVHRHLMVIAQGETPPLPPLPPEPPAAPLPPLPPAPPAPPAPPPAPPYAFHMRYDMRMHDQMRRDTEATVRSAMALARAEVGRASKAQRQAICRQLAEAQAAVRSQAVEMARAEAQAALESPEVRHAMDEARRTSDEEVRRALAQARDEMRRAEAEARAEVSEAQRDAEKAQR